ncbi:MAG: efflux transporter periplasmic adaptor subunit [Hydrogenophilales bacterium 16-64-46]|nr:MAG: efflux transporter periplasmic adaptor subunit [Hydrogenophilales bacterium 12-64-13]OYZ07173.1 MAG: efflux transporter periplasmic adaptor subunit [Hydrogenophilales bacterium 16-64-46]OZA37358.1 MAG: efflux transporter periplasmic adaptor subunit [Hydrogenophilales bacterium 17-64-34]HQT00624.1 efflux RND transporter periplasmic adaptor subunit [Thiobacillus sp.]
MKVRILVAVVVIALIAGVVYRIQQQDQAAGPRGAGGPGGGPALAVKTVPVVVRDFPVIVEVPGTLEAAQQAVVSAQVGGVLLRQQVQEGDTVRAGQILFSLDARAAQTQIAQNQASLASARVEVADAQKKVERLQPLLSPGYISQQEIDDAVLVREAAGAKVAAAEAALDAARLDVGYAAIRAPFAGRVGRIAVKPGDLVQAGTALTTLTQARELDVRASVAQQDWPVLASAQARGSVDAEIYTDLGKTPVAQGRLDFVDTQLDAASGAVQIKVRLASLPVGLLPGQSVRVRLAVGVEKDARVVPEAALQHAQDGTYVYVVRAGKAAVQNVMLLRALDGMMAVEGRLAAGEPVLIEIPQRLKADGAVRLEGQRSAGAGAGAQGGARESRP